jgi:7-carboxy-7-deazaguanine synthase
VIARVRELGVPLVEITGGEPLLQRAVPELAQRLLDDGRTVLVETGGHHDISVLDPRVHAIVDVKAPGSGMAAKNDLANLARLRPGDEVKLVLLDRADYEWARALVREHGLAGRVPVHFSPVHGKLEPAELAAWILEDGLPVRLHLQLHKYVWGADARGV